MILTFRKYWQVNLGYMSIEAEDRFEMGFDDIACQVCDDYNSGVWFSWRVRIYIHIRVFSCIAWR